MKKSAVLKLSAISEVMCAGKIQTKKLLDGINNPVTKNTNWIGRSARATIINEFNQHQLHIQIFQDENMGESICNTKQAVLSNSYLTFIFDLELVNLEQNPKLNEEQLDKMSQFYFGDSRIVQVYQIVEDQPEYTTELNSYVRSYFEFPAKKDSKNRSNFASESILLTKGKVLVPIRHLIVSEKGEIASVDYSVKQVNGLPTMSAGFKVGLKELKASSRDAALGITNTYSFTGNNINAVLCKAEETLK